MEGFNRTLGQILQGCSEEEKEDWNMYIPAALFAYRSIKQATTKYLPFFLLYGYEPKTPFDMDHYVHEKNSPKFEALLVKSRDRWEGPFIIHQVLDKGTYHIKSYDTEDTKLRRVHGNRLKPHMLPKINWTEEHERTIPTILDSETQELLH